MKPSKQNINGVLLLDKDSGMTSNRALQECKRKFNAAKAGHTGSLDPLASGVLPICFGDATKFARFLLEADKTYLVTATLGVITDTSDSEGTVIATSPVPNFTQAEILTAINQFVGPGQQIPSMYSALKHQGQPLYKLARKNITVDRAARDIFIYEFVLIEFVGNQLTCKVRCSKGTYIRTLIEDLGNILGCGAHVSMLRRTQAGPFDISRAITLNELNDIADLNSMLLPMETLLEGLPKIVLNAVQADHIRHGRQVNLLRALEPGIVCLFCDENSLLGIGEATNDGHIAPIRLVAAP
jgi:tRNA pseudouridine55 synthase